jgi:hypothetical protein
MIPIVSTPQYLKHAKFASRNLAELGSRNSQPPSNLCTDVLQIHGNAIRTSVSFYSIFTSGIFGTAIHTVSFSQ